MTVTATAMNAARAQRSQLTWSRDHWAARIAVVRTMYATVSRSDLYRSIWCPFSRSGARSPSGRGKLGDRTEVRLDLVSSPIERGAHLADEQRERLLEGLLLAGRQ